jgi:hypothetical protein
MMGSTSADLVDISEEDEENHLQDISTMEKRYQGKWN